jgi:hypothetical protein
MRYGKWRYYALVLALLCCCVPTVHAENASWTFTTSHEIASLSLSEDGSTIAVGGSRLYVLDGLGGLLWNGWSGDDVILSQTGEVVITYQRNSLFAFDRKGEKLWEKDLDTDIWGVASDEKASRIMAGILGNVVVFDESGSEPVRTNTTGEEKLLTTRSARQIFIVTDDGLSSFDIYEGYLWKHDGWGKVGVIDSEDDFVYYGGQSWIYSVPTSFTWYQDEAKERWKYNIKGALSSLAVTDDGRYIAAGSRDLSENSVDNYVYLFNREGDLLWRAQADGWVNDVGIGSGRYPFVAAATSSDAIHFYNLNDGAPLFSLSTEGDALFVVTDRYGALTVAADKNHLYGIDGEMIVTALRPTPTPRPTTEVRTPTPTPTTGATTPAATEPSATTPTPLPLSTVIIAAGAAGYLAMRRHG